MLNNQRVSIVENHCKIHENPTNQSANQSVRVASVQDFPMPAKVVLKV